jgi:hypothetical protein
VAGRKPNIRVDIWPLRNFVVFHRMGLSICNGRLGAVMGVVPSLLTGFARDSHSNRLTKAMQQSRQHVVTWISFDLQSADIWARDDEDFILRR